jgi:hypothetical protein
MVAICMCMTIYANIIRNNFNNEYGLLAVPNKSKQKVKKHVIGLLRLIYPRGRRGRDGMVVVFTMTTKVVSSNPVHGEVYFTQHYVIKLVSYLRQVGGFLRFPHPIKQTATIH